MKQSKNQVTKLEWATKVLFRFDGRPDGIKEYLSHDCYRITDPKWLKFLESPKYELLDDDPTMIWEDSESHETWVLFDPEFLQTGEHLNKTENQTATYTVRIQNQHVNELGAVSNWRVLSVGTYTGLTRMCAALKAFSSAFGLTTDVVEDSIVTEEESGNYGSYSFVHENQTYYAHVDRQ